MLALMLLVLLPNFEFGMFQDMKIVKANMLDQQASGYDVNGRNFHVQEKPMHEDLHFFRVGTDQLAKSIDQVVSAGTPSAMAKLARPTALVGQGDSPVTSSINSPRSFQIGPP
jgi:hypothetical protein